MTERMKTKKGGPTGPTFFVGGERRLSGASISAVDGNDTQGQ
jgi:hypothetical protein